MTTQMVIRIDDGLKNQFSRLAKREGKSLSELVRELLLKYAQERDASGHIDQLWQRIGATLEDQGVTEAMIERAITEVRARD